MPDTPLSTRILRQILENNDWQQADLAKCSGIDRATVSMHLTGARAVRDDHLAAYIAHLSQREREALLAAWLRDVLPASSAQGILQPDTDTLTEEVRVWQPGLDEEQRQMLYWVARQLAADEELDNIFRALMKRAGWKPSLHRA